MLDNEKNSFKPVLTEKLDTTKEKEEMKLRIRTRIVIKPIMLVTIAMFAVWKTPSNNDILPDKNLLLLWAIIAMLAFVQIWLLTVFITGLCKVNIFKILGRKKQPSNKVF